MTKGGGPRPWSGIHADIRRAATTRGRALLGSFVIEGLRAHERAVAAGRPPSVALVGRGFAAAPPPRASRLLAALRQAGCRLECAPDELLQDLTRGRSIGPLVGLAPLPAVPALADLLQVAPALLLVAVGVEDPGNLGALARTALASGAGGLIVVGPGDPYHPRAVRTSMGSLFKLPVLRQPELGPLSDELRHRAVVRLGAVSRGGVPLPALRLEPGRSVAVHVGSEAFGLSAEGQDGMDALVSVPMVDGVDSLSVNAAAAVILYEMRRAQRPADVAPDP
jgi:TrmH family RNA methyltransferase